jgi:hypothetical protein
MLDLASEPTPQDSDAAEGEAEGRDSVSRTRLIMTAVGGVILAICAFGLFQYADAGLVPLLLLVVGALVVTGLVIFKVQEGKRRKRP